MDAWNLSWVGTDDAHGWVRLDVGAGENGTCSFVSKESQDLGIVWNRESAPAVLSMGEVEEMLLAEGRFPEFVGSKGLFDVNGDHNDGLRRGVLVAVPDDGLTGLISELVDGEAGATTYDYVRTWKLRVGNRRSALRWTPPAGGSWPPPSSSGRRDALGHRTSAADPRGPSPPKPPLRA